jgi:hypothetical protein
MSISRPIIACYSDSARVEAVDRVQGTVVREAAHALLLNINHGPAFLPTLVSDAFHDRKGSNLPVRRQNITDVADARRLRVNNLRFGCFKTTVHRL